LKLANDNTKLLAKVEGLQQKVEGLDQKVASLAAVARESSVQIAKLETIVQASFSQSAKLEIAVENSSILISQLLSSLTAKNSGKSFFWTFRTLLVAISLLQD